jgi:hypothetical protein
MSTTEFDNPVEPSAPEVTVLIVSDYAGSEGTSWKQLHETLLGLAAQEFSGSAEFILLDSHNHADKFPNDPESTLPGLRVELAPVSQDSDASNGLKNHGVRLARTKWVMVLDADCVPAPGWLHAAIQAVSRHPDAAAVSGKTIYGGRNLRERILDLLSRAYLDRRGEGHTRFVSNNNAIFRRAVYIKHPLPVGGGPFAARIQSDTLSRNGYELFFEPAMVVTHDFEGWSREVNSRRNIGWATIKIRQLNPILPHAWAIRLGPFALFYFYGGHVVESWWNILRIGHDYGLRWYEKPLAMAAALYVHALEVGGMLTALTHSNHRHESGD